MGTTAMDETIYGSGWNQCLLVATPSKRSLAQCLSSDITTTKCLRLYPADEQAFIKANSTVPIARLGCGRTSLQHSRTDILQTVLQHVWHYAFLKRHIGEMLLVLLNEQLLSIVKSGLSTSTSTRHWMQAL